MGRGYTAFGVGVTELFTTLYSYDNSLSDGTNYIEFKNGETLIVNWTESIA